MLNKSYKWDTFNMHIGESRIIYIPDIKNPKTKIVSFPDQKDLLEQVDSGYTYASYAY